MRALIGISVLCLLLAGCVPVRPEGVPRDASMAYNWKGSGWTWSWQRTPGNGCIDWRAWDDYAVVYVSIEQTMCGAPNGNGVHSIRGRGANYRSFDDYLTFFHYWPKPGAPSGRPCPQSLSTEEIGELRSVIRLALAQEISDGEARMLTRIDELLAATNGAALTTDFSGWCNDLSLDDYHQAGSRDEHDAWRPN